MTSFYVVQNLAPTTNLLVGKINAIDLLAGDPFFGGWGTRRFQNVAFVAPPSGVVPATIMGSVLTHQAGDVGRRYLDGRMGWPQDIVRPDCSRFDQPRH